MSNNRLANLSRRLMVACGVAGALALGLAGCGGKASTGPTQMVPLTLVAQGLGGSTARYAAPAGAVFTTATADTDTIPVTFTKALLVVRDVRLVRPEVMDDSTGQTDSLGATDSLDVSDGEDDGEDHEGDDQGQVRFHGPFVIDLLSGTAARLDTMMVEPGDYKRIQDTSGCFARVTSTPRTSPAWSARPSGSRERSTARAADRSPSSRASTTNS